MSRASVWFALPIAITALSGCANDPSPSQANAPRQAPMCFQASSVRNFTAVDSRTVNVRVGRDVYRLDIMGICPDINWTNRMRLVTSGSRTVCTGVALGTSIEIRGPNGRPQRCAVQSVRALTPQEVEALPNRHRP